MSDEYNSGLAMFTCPAWTFSVRGQGHAGLGLVPKGRYWQHQWRFGRI